MKKKMTPLLKAMKNESGLLNTPLNILKKKILLTNLKKNKNG